ncbi:MarR family winged helix-turn-helix transcriptional regulator [Pleomorphomonas sp. NRK KF1]|uniref:MarR family winged helix-turn-helix transcriptional regulator n=1 Tax=Pleomorphomonas sp. NRK KF1 TaxID=2943000 RepID=UPI002044C622|nr:MarR family transcriptional regulator [Pleomorphomonas sp. NRK KF1]MCM5554062.1 MarR family transcriptional regulator [Pleomorphomonas sp. NRK KF1]
MSRQPDGAQDGVDARRAQWAAELPDLDTAGMAILGRMRWITLSLRPPIEAIFRKYGIDSGEFDVIATLRRSGPPYCLRPTELYRWLMISSGGLTARLARLEKAGLITRLPDPDDARSMLVQLTPEGADLTERAFREDMAFESKVLAALTANEQATLESLLRKLALSDLNPEVGTPS